MPIGNVHVEMTNCNNYDMERGLTSVIVGDITRHIPACDADNPDRLQAVMEEMLTIHATA